MSEAKHVELPPGFMGRVKITRIPRENIEEPWAVDLYDHQNCYFGCVSSTESEDMALRAQDMFRQALADAYDQGYRAGGMEGLRQAEIIALSSPKETDPAEIASAMARRWKVWSQPQRIRREGDGWPDTPATIAEAKRRRAEIRDSIDDDARESQR